MGSTKKFWTSVVVGAVAGGLVSLLDRETRKAVSERCGTLGKNISYAVTHPGEVIDNIKDKANEIRNTASEMSEDISYLIHKIEEVRDLTPEVTEFIRDTKEAFEKDTVNVEK